MSDSLTVFGVDYTGVAGIKAKGTGNGTLTYIRPTGTKSITANGTGIDVAAYATVDVSVSGGGSADLIVTLTQDSTTGNWLPDKTFAQLSAAYANESNIIFEGAVQEYQKCPTSYDWYSDGAEFQYRIQWFDYYEILSANGYFYYDTYNYTASGLTLHERQTLEYPLVLQTKTNVSPTTSSQTITPDIGYDGLSSVQINAMPSGTAGTPSASKGPVSNHQISVTPSVTNTTGYITGGTKTGTAVTVSASELVSGTVTISGSGTTDVTNYASASVAAGGATASATKGSVSNHSVSVTPSVTRTAGWVTAGTASGTAVTVSASELVSGTYTVSASGTHDVTNYASASVAAGGATASATKGSVSNHSVTVTPSVTRTAGYVTAGTSNGTAVTVSASELVSGSQTITDNGTVDVTNLASVTVDIDFVTYYTSSSAPTSSQGSDGDIWLVTS